MLLTLKCSKCKQCISENNSYFWWKSLSKQEWKQNESWMTIKKLFSCDELPAYGKCEKVQKEICDPVERQVCEEVTEKVCQLESQTVPKEKCEDMTVEKCVPVQRDVCEVVAREKCVTVSEEVPFEVCMYCLLSSG